jgi:GNAT superfamily N-acetyltransferase
MENFKTYTKRLNKISNSTIKNKLFYLTLAKEDGDEDSMMLHELCRYLRSGINSDAIVTIAMVERKYVAWSFTITRHHQPKSMFYVLPEYRGQGVGKMLFNKTAKSLKKRGYSHMYVAPWDRCSSNFFSKMNCTDSPIYDYFFNKRIKI